MRMRRLNVLGFILVLAFCCSATAQGPSTDTLRQQVEDYKAEATKYRDVAVQLKQQNDELRKRVEGTEVALWARYLKAKESEYDFQVQMMGVNTRNFQHQSIASYVILFLVVCVVLAGLWFARIQLMAGLQPITTASSQAAQNANQTATTSASTAASSSVPTASTANLPITSTPMPNIGTTTFAAELGKVTITSSVVGVVVLVISLAFLYIYTREVYEIQIIDPYRPKILDPSEMQQSVPTKK